MILTAAIEVLLGLCPFQLQLQSETKAEIYRLDRNYQWKPKPEDFENACMRRNVKENLASGWELIRLHQGTLLTIFYSHVSREMCVERRS